MSMKPLALLAGVMIGAGAMGIAQAQTAIDISEMAMVNEPLKLTPPVGAR